jgi:hypothetical protein
MVALLWAAAGPAISIKHVASMAIWDIGSPSYGAILIQPLARRNAAERL